MKGPRDVSKILTHCFASVFEQGNLMCFSNEVSERKGYKIEKSGKVFTYVSYHHYLRTDTHNQNVSKI